MSKWKEFSISQRRVYIYTHIYIYVYIHTEVLHEFGRYEELWSALPGTSYFNSSDHSRLTSSSTSWCFLCSHTCPWHGERWACNSGMEPFVQSLHVWSHVMSLRDPDCMAIFGFTIAMALPGTWNRTFHWSLWSQLCRWKSTMQHLSLQKRMEPQTLRANIVHSFVLHLTILRFIVRGRKHEKLWCQKSGLGVIQS